ncbi:MAG: hydrogenase maturation protease [Planctomycetaceae bacterium]|nr:hydrogenase maturation protease [Planctomycetaceae bacterium]
MSGQHTLFVGIGSPHGDDQIGWKVADRLREASNPCLSIRQASTPSQLLDWLEGVRCLLVCDAFEQLGSAPIIATIHRWEWPTNEIEQVRSTNSHTFGLPAVLELAAKLGTLPDRVIVLGVPGHQFDAFADVSLDVELRLPCVVEQVLGEIEEVMGTMPQGAASHA